MNRWHRRFTTLAIMVGLFVAALDQTIVDTAFPRMVAELGGVSLFTWVITTYLLASTAIIPVVGKLSDIYGRKLFWALGVTLFVGGSVLCGQAASMTQLILFRGIQGLGAGMIMPVAQTIIGDLYTGPERARMQGLFTGVFALASAIGPLVGGWIVDVFHWRYIFLINVPTGGIALLLSAWSLKDPVRGKRRKVDWLGALLFVAAVSSLLLGLQGGGEQGPYAGWQRMALFGAGAIATALFIAVQLRADEPILDLKLFANRTFAVTVLIAFIIGAGMFGAIVFFPWFIQGVIGASATSSGTVLLPMTIMMVVASVLGGQVAQRTQYRWQMGGGLLLMAGGFLLATRFGTSTTLWEARAAIMVLGFGLGLVHPILVVAVQQAFDRSRRGTVTAMPTFFRSIGSAVGVTAFGALFNVQMDRQFDRVLAPQLAGFPASVRSALTDLAAKPSDLVQLLLRPQALEALPPDVRPSLVEAIKAMMTNASHAIFWTSVAIVLCGMLIAQCLGRESLTAQLKRDGLNEK